MASRKRLRLTLALGFLLALTACLVPFFSLVATARIQEKRAAFLREFPAALAAGELHLGSTLVQDPLFGPLSGDDAGPFLNERLNWAEGRGDLASEECVRILNAAGAEWRSLKRDQLEGCDTAWLHDLRRFGRWSLDFGFRSRLPAGPRDQFGLPNLIDLQTGAKLHLLRCQGSDCEEAAQDVRHLARLLFTQHYLMSAMMGIALLSIEARSHELASVPWSAPPLSSLEREELRRHLFIAVFALNPLAPLEVTADTIEGLPGFRRCLLLTEHSFMNLRSELPELADCDLGHARWELAHPYRQLSSPEPLKALSWPAQLGGALTARLAPERYAELAKQLESADYLPATGRWASGASEEMESFMSP